MADRPIIVIADAALFDLGLSVGFGAAIGVIAAVALHHSAGLLFDRLAELFRRSS